MEISVEDENGVGKSISSVTGFKNAVGFLLMSEVQLSNGVYDSSDLL